MCTPISKNDSNDSRWSGSTKKNISDEMESFSQPAYPVEINTIPNDDINQLLQSNGNYMNLIDASNQVCYRSTKTEPVKDFQFHNVDHQIPNSKIDDPEIFCDNIADLLKSFVEVNLPEIKFQMLLDFVQFSLSQLVSYLAVGCQLLIEKLDEIRWNHSDQSVYSDYQIELRRTKSNASCYQLYLRVDPEEWYDLEYENDPNIQSKVKSYTNRVKHECCYNKSSMRINDNRRYRRTPCVRPGVCEKGEQCGFFVCNEHQIYTEEGAWYAVVRCNQRPVITINPKQHYNNEQWVVTTGAWEIFWQVVDNLQYDLQLKELPFERVCINFGKWQTQADKNGLKPNDCHAHLNMVLTTEAINSCKSAPEHLRILKYSTKYPQDHRLDDANMLDKMICNQVDKEPLSPDVDKYPCMLKIHAKPTAIRSLSGKNYGKTNTIFYNVFT